MDLVQRHAVTRTGRLGAPAMVLGPGFGCDQDMWRHVAPAFESDHEVVRFDHVGSGQSDVSAYDPEHYDDLQAYADDIVLLSRELGLRDIVLVGHSVAAMMAVLAQRAAPDLFAALVLVGPSACYVDDLETGYVGGFDERDVEELLELLGSNYLGWSRSMAPVIMGNADRPELGQELTDSFCRTDPDVARQFARLTFTSDNRADLPHVSAPTLVLQCTDDTIAPLSAGRYVHDAIPDSTWVHLDAVGHLPHLSSPDETIAAIRSFLDARA